MHAKEEKAKKLTRINFRPLLFCALGLCFGIYLYGKIFFGGLSPASFLFIALVVCLALPPLFRGRVCAILLTVCIFFGIGMLSIHLCTVRYESGESGTYRVAGTVQSVARKRGYSIAVLGDITFNGERRGGKFRVELPDTEAYAGDIVLFSAEAAALDTKGIGSDPYLLNYFVKDIRYSAAAAEYEKVGLSKNPFLRLNGALDKTLRANMGKDEATLAFALLTGNSGNIEEGLSETVRRGGIAHIFAVSGLHIGILYSAVYLCCKRLKRYRVLPAFFAALLYCAFCNFTVSSVRAVIMCGVLGLNRFLGRKPDLLHSISLAAILTLLIMPRQWFAVGMQLSYGACIGLALFSGAFTRLFTRLKFPRFLREYLASALSVQIATFSILLNAFGYVSALALLLNFFLIPLLPLLFLCTLLCAVFALIIPPAAPFFLLFPDGLFAAMIYLLSAVDVTLVLSGFALGAGTVVWITGCVLLCERVRMEKLLRGVACGAIALLFTAALVLENAVFTGCRIDLSGGNNSAVALVRTRKESVLILNEYTQLETCEDFLSRTYGGTLTAVVVLAESEVGGVKVAMFLPAEQVILRRELETGLQNTPIRFAEQFELGQLSFRFLSGSKLLLQTEGSTVEFEFGRNGYLGADLCIGQEQGCLKYFLKDGIIKA